MSVKPKLLTGFALAALLCGCVAPEAPPAPPRPAAAATPATPSNQADYEPAPTPNRQVRGPSGGVIQVDKTSKRGS